MGRIFFPQRTTNNNSLSFKIGSQTL
jgi:hypothetical protein